MQLFRTTLFKMNVILIGTLFVVVHCACKSKGGKKTATTQQLPLQKLITTRKGTGYSDSNATTILPKTSLTPHRTTFQDCSRCPTPSPVNYPTRLPCPSCASCPVYPTCSPCPGCPDIPTPSPCTNELQDCSRCPTPSPVDCNCPQPTPSPCHDCPVCTTCSPCPGCPDPPTPAPQALPIDMMPFGAELEDDLSEDDADCEYDSSAEHFRISCITQLFMYGILTTIHLCIVP